MNPPRKSLLIGNLLQQSAKLYALFCGQCRKQNILMFSCYLAYAAQDLRASIGQME